jgi:hypothetical protein
VDAQAGFVSGGVMDERAQGVTFEWLEHVPTAMDVFPQARRGFDLLPWRL